MLGMRGKKKLPSDSRDKKKKSVKSFTEINSRQFSLEIQKLVLAKNYSKKVQTFIFRFELISRLKCDQFMSVAVDKQQIKLR